MCGRFTLGTPLNVLLDQFAAQLASPLQLAMRYNVAPSQHIPVIRLHEGHRELTTMRWGLIPSWAKDPKIGFSGINARADTVATKPMFRSAFKKRRCLVLADGTTSGRRTAKPSYPSFTRSTAVSRSPLPACGSSGGDRKSPTSRRWRAARSSRPKPTSWPGKCMTGCQ